MIVGGSKREVIVNIKKNIKNQEFNNKVEINDAILSDEEKTFLIQKFYKQKKSLAYGIKNKIANIIIQKVGKNILKDINVLGEENLLHIDLSHGAIITCNHFNPLDSYNARKVVEELLNKKLYIVIQDTNLAMPGKLGFLMNYSNTIPLSKSPNYILKTFIPEIKKILDNKGIVLIYPEEEMWFNYRKPRPCKRGAYQFACEMGVPIISLFVQMDNLATRDNEEFFKVHQTVHILKALSKDDTKSLKDNGINLARLDYEQKKEAYEKAYNKKLTYDFSIEDIAGYSKQN